MMIGLLISMITIAAILVLYKTMIGISGNASRSALRDGQVASALLAAQIELQSAGFGVPNAEPLANKFAISADGKQVVWLGKPDLNAGGYQCSGLEIIDADGQGTTRGLYRLPAKPCASVGEAHWAATEYEPMAAGAAFFVPTQADGTALADTEREVEAASLAPGYHFTLQPAVTHCLPYMQQDFAAIPVGTPKAPQIALGSDDGSRQLFALCLPNLATL